VFLGQELDAILNELEKTSVQAKISPKAPLQLGISRIPQLLRDNTDRNRTSPFAFTGNKFEFRAVGSSANIASPMIVLNTIVANQLLVFKAEVDKRIEKGEAKEVAIAELLRKYVKETKAIRFEGNGYSDEWKAEAQKRGLSNITSTPEALDAIVSAASVKLFEGLEIMSERELHARHEIRLEIYAKKIGIEAQVLSEMAMSQVVPAALQYQKELIESVEAMKDIELPAASYATHVDLIKQISTQVTTIVNGVEKMDKAREKAERVEEARARAIAFQKTVVGQFEVIRNAVDTLETVVDDERWPLPKYREMLFMK